MQDETTANRQLTLDFSEGFVVPEPLSVPRNVTRTIVFPKHISIQNVGRFQRQIIVCLPRLVSLLNLGLHAEAFEMKWIFLQKQSLSLCLEFKKRYLLTTQLRNYQMKR